MRIISKKLIISAFFTFGFVYPSMKFNSMDFFSSNTYFDITCDKSFSDVIVQVEEIKPSAIYIGSDVFGEVSQQISLINKTLCNMYVF